MRDDNIPDVGIDCHHEKKILSAYMIACLTVPRVQKLYDILKGEYFTESGHDLIEHRKPNIHILRLARFLSFLVTKWDRVFKLAP